MNISEKRNLINLNNSFYQQIAPQFAATRNHAWPGWKELPLRTGDQHLDVACGNMRFRTFLSNKLSDFEYLGIDACADLAAAGQQDLSEFQQIDILQHYLNGSDWRQELPSHHFDHIFCCAFLHHVPGRDWQNKLLQELWSLLPIGGYLTVSFWQFLSDSASTKLIVRDLGDDDYILSWNRGTYAERYCHNFTDNEVNERSLVITNQQGQVIKDWSADGPSGSMNRYLTWEKKNLPTLNLGD